MDKHDCIASDYQTLKVTAELQANIAAIIFYMSPHQSCTKLELLVHPSSLSILQYRDEKLFHQVKLLSSVVYFCPTSFCNFSKNATTIEGHHKDGIRILYPEVGDSENKNTVESTISFRLQVNIEGPISVNDEQTFPSFDYSFDDGCTVRCITCDSDLHDEPVRFQVVSAPLTSEDDVAENFFCHNHECSLPPAEEDACHVLRASTTCYFFTCLDPLRLIKDCTKKVYRCKKCDTILSRKDTQSIIENVPSIGCFKDKVYFHSENNTEKADEEYLAFLVLHDMVVETVASSVVCKLYLDCEYGLPSEKSCLLVQVIDDDLKQSVVTCTPSDNKTEKHLEFKTVMKVLYQVVVPSSEIASQWRHAFAVDCFHVSETMFRSVVKLLNKNTLSLPNSELLSGFTISYLHFK